MRIRYFFYMTWLAAFLMSPSQLTAGDELPAAARSRVPNAHSMVGPNRGMLQPSVPEPRTVRPIFETRPPIPAGDGTIVEKEKEISTSYTYTVTNTGNSGAGSLRQAILSANGHSGPDVIRFNIPGSGPRIITPTTPLPPITGPVIIDGYSQPGTSMNTIGSGFASNALIRIVIDGSAVDVPCAGLTVNSAGCKIRGLAINKFPYEGIIINGSGCNTNLIEGCFIGTDATGLTPQGNGFVGISVLTSGNVIGGTTAASRNIIAANGGAGIAFHFGGSNIAKNNVIGVGANGTTVMGSVAAALSIGSGEGWGIFIGSGSPSNIVGGLEPFAPNFISRNASDGIMIADSASKTNQIKGNSILSNGGDGICVVSSSGNIIGGSTVAQRNIVGGNAGAGISIEGSAAAGNVIVGNYVGVKADGVSTVANQAGVVLLSSRLTQIGGSAVGLGNLISGNTTYGILITGSNNTIQKNFIGTNAGGTSAVANASAGLLILNGSSNLVGGPLNGNLISGNLGDGVVASGALATGNTIQSNKIGTDLSGNNPLPNSTGISILDAPGTMIGGQTAGTGNLVSGNSADGMLISGSTATGTLIQGNSLGVNGAGATSLGNGRDGVLITNGASGTNIGGNTSAASNVISGNLNGIELAGAGSAGNLIQGNFIGTDATGMSAIPNANSGLMVFASSNTIIGGSASGERNVISGNGDEGMYIGDIASAGTVIRGNYVGVDVTGLTALSNFSGIDVDAAAAGTIIGGTDPGAGNVVSGNIARGVGLFAASSASTLQGNYIGTGFDGMTALPNGYGVLVIESPANIIGSDLTPDGRNIISGNTGDGIGLWNSGTTGTLIARNLIGTAVDGHSPLGNVSPLDGAGIALRNSTSGNTITENTIAYNGPSGGIRVYSGNANRISRNSIFGNNGLGIDLEVDGSTPNDPLDIDGGANDQQNFPALTMAANDIEVVEGSLQSEPNTLYTIEFFMTGAPDPSGYGEGETFIGTVDILTDGGGSANFSIQLPGVLVAGKYLTTTVTNPSGETSEFSANVLIFPKVKYFGDHFVVNTTLSGIPLHWPDGNAGYSIGPSVPAAYVPFIDSGFGAWGSLPLLTYTNLGPSPFDTWGGTSDGINNVVWVENGWEDSTGTDSNTIAVTRVRYNALNGEMTDVDLAFDADHFAWTTTDDTTSSPMNVRNVTTHESGHFSGLGDIYNVGDPGYIPLMGDGNQNVTMYGLIKDGEINKSDLDAPDIAGIQYIYDQVPSSNVDLMLIYDGSESFAATYGALQPSLDASQELIDKMRIGDNIGIVQMPAQELFLLRQITGQSTKDSVKAILSALTAGGQSAIGSALETAQSRFNVSSRPERRKAVVLFSAGEENALPSAISAVSSLVSGGTKAFTLGFAGSSGQSLSDSIASRTGGAYFLATDSTLGDILDQIWSRLTGTQLIGDTAVPSSSIPPFDPNQPGLRWQGRAEAGTQELLPGLRWQGITSSATTLAAPKAAGTIQAINGIGRYILRVITPDNLLIDSAAARANPSDGIDFFSGATYNYFTIKNPRPGIWTLDAQAIETPVNPSSVQLYLAAASEVTMDIRFDKALYNPGDPIDVVASLSRGGQSAGDVHIVGGGPVTDATVYADIVIPKTGEVRTIELLHTGYGEYKGTLSGTSRSGSYKFTVRASRGDDFDRTSSQAVFVIQPFRCPANISVPADPGQCSAVVTYEVLRGDSTVFPGLTILSTPPSGSAFPVGTTVVTCIGVDNAGHADTATFTVTVRDLQPPVIANVFPSPNVLWPPNHRMVTVTLAYSCQDNCTSSSCAVTVSSNEPVKKKNDDEDCLGTTPDWIVVDAHTVQLRAERYGRGKGRIYTITVTCTDESGNSSSQTAIVLVPKSKGNGHSYDNGGHLALTELPDVYQLDQNYPNPFNPLTQVDFALPQDAKVSLKIYSTLGELVATVADGIFDAGYQTVEFDGSALASGVYFYRLEAVGIADPNSSFLQIRKMMLVK